MGLRGGLGVGVGVGCGVGLGGRVVGGCGYRVPKSCRLCDL